MPLASGKLQERFSTSILNFKNIPYNRAQCVFPQVFYFSLLATQALGLAKPVTSPAHDGENGLVQARVATEPEHFFVKRDPYGQPCSSPAD